MRRSTAHPHSSPTGPELKVAVLVWGLGGGAFTNLGTTLVRGMRGIGTAAELVTVHEPTHEQRDRFADIPIYSLSSQKTVLAIPRLVRYLRARNPDILLSMPQNVNLSAIAASRIARTGTRLVVSEHTTLSNEITREAGKARYYRTASFLARALYPWADALVAPSWAILDDASFAPVRRRFSKATARIPNPVALRDADIEAAARASAPHAWLSPDRAMPVFVAAGRMVHQKGFDSLLHALALLHKRQCHARLLLLGAGPAEPQLRAIASDLGVAGAVSFEGFVPDPVAYLAHSDGFVLSSKWEGFGLVLVEAMACGLPIVSTDAPGGPQEILHQRHNALIVPVDDASALADAMETILAERQLARSLGRQARDDAERYSPHRVATEYVQFFQSLLP